MNSIKFEREISGSGRIDDELHEFLSEIKAEVYEKAKASQKKYIVFNDLCTMVTKGNLDNHLKLQKEMSYYDLLKNEEQWYEDNKQSYDEFLEYFDENDFSTGWSFLDDIEYNYEKHEVKNFNEEYESFTRNFINEILKINQRGEYIIINVKIEFYFRDSYDFGDFHEGDIVYSF